MKKVYLDIMVDGMFYCQLPYLYLPFMEIDIREVEAYVLEKRPSLKGKNINIAFSNERIFSN